MASGNSIYHRGNTPSKSSVHGQSRLNYFLEPNRAYKAPIPVWTVPHKDNVNITEYQLSSKKFVWPYGGTDVKLTGIFDNWQASIQMTPVNISNLNDNIFQVIVKGLDLSKDIQFKFVVDGEWCYDMRRPHVTEASGNINNIIYAEK
ncbi:hypothetical protein INT48_003196 [Thamnidium elegans]|uniref:AMP-activated protein kinase glycogen-binding domain-containing protein n=1 Tax=Thamnidium elegans TaxID=101142 RepID=A0A8H7SS38_9FUNG|nr:hypothetical protein INT48_003196 [Thamnidium elegans]